MATRLRGYAATWLSGYAATWLRGYAATQLRSYVVKWLRGYADTQLRSYVAKWLRGYVATRLNYVWGYVSVWILHELILHDIGVFFGYIVRVKRISIFLISFVSLLLLAVDEAECTHGEVNKISSVVSSRLCCLNMYTVKGRKTTGVQSGCSTADLKDHSTQCGDTKGSYGRDGKKDNFTETDLLKCNVLQ